MAKKLFILLVLVCCLVGCGKDEYTYTPIDFPDNSQPPEPALSEEELLDIAQGTALKYFWDFAEANSGAARERYHPDDPGFDASTVATGGTGFGLMALLVGIERGFIDRQQGFDRIKKILDFFERADRFHGAWPHWLDGTTARVKPFSALDNGGDLVETSFLAQGLICVQEYFKNGTAEEQALSSLAADLWQGVEWDWYTQGQQTLYWHWSPEHNFAINLPLRGYNEVLITYVMAAASPDYGINKEVYTAGWAGSGAIRSQKTRYGYPLLVNHAGAPDFGGPLFWAHYSYQGLNPRGLSDEFVDYGQVNINHARINYQYCVENPRSYDGYSEAAWGLTASYSRNADGSMGYSAHHPANDKGIISPTAALSSFPYTPAESMRALRYFYQEKDKLLGPAGFYDAFSPGNSFWVAEAYLAIDQGPIVNMIENHRTGFLWDLFMGNAEVRAGLDKLGFSYQ